MFSKLDRHDRQMTEMFARSGFDVSGDDAEPDISPSLYRGCLMRCACCDKLEACSKFLDGAQGDQNEPPKYCRNRDEIDRLKRIRADRDN